MLKETKIDFYEYIFKKCNSISNYNSQIYFQLQFQKWFTTSISICNIKSVCNYTYNYNLQHRSQIRITKVFANAVYNYI